jgi:hypothetical protein
VASKIWQARAYRGAVDVGGGARGGGAAAYARRAGPTRCRQAQSEDAASLKGTRGVGPTHISWRDTRVILGVPASLSSVYRCRACSPPPLRPPPLLHRAPLRAC